MPDQRALYEPYARQIAERYGLDPEIFVRQITQESQWNPRAVSHAGAVGLGQIVPGYHPDANVWDPYANLEYAARHMRRLLDKYGRYDLALAAYNAGEGNVTRYGGVPPFAETQTYVRRILGEAPSRFRPSDRGALEPATWQEAKSAGWREYGHRLDDGRVQKWYTDDQGNFVAGEIEAWEANQGLSPYSLTRAYQQAQDMYGVTPGAGIGATGYSYSGGYELPPAGYGFAGPLSAEEQTARAWATRTGLPPPEDPSNPTQWPWGNDYAWQYYTWPDGSVHAYPNWWEGPTPMPEAGWFASLGDLADRYAGEWPAGVISATQGDDSEAGDQEDETDEETSNDEEEADEGIGW